jgi:hypothetical protein
MQVRSPRLLATFLTLTLVGFGLAPTRAADEPDLKGDWRLIQVSPFTEREILRFEVEQEGSKLDVAVKDSPSLRPTPKVQKAQWSGGELSIDLTIAGGDATLRGRADKDGQIYGTLKLQGQTIPVRLVKSDAEKGSKPQTGDRALIQSYVTARGERDPKEKARKLAELADKEAPSLTRSLVYSDLLRVAGSAGLSQEDVRGYLEKWVSAAKPYGAESTASVRTQALKALSGHKPYAGLALELANEAERELGPGGSTETKAEIARGIADAAKLLGKMDLAASAESQALKYEAALDEEYHQKVPPFKPEVAEGRKGGKGDRVVLLELFTGAQCPPCVAADVAFDALDTTYAPSELVALQYHLHIPGPDPLTNADSVARAKYYPDLRGTPSTFFNGKSEAGGGGNMGMSKGKYDEYRRAIETQLEQAKEATIDLQVDRSGDEVKINAIARAEEGKAKEGDGSSKLRLRLALVEEQVRYVGGNKLRFHHHVVRAMPGGVEGKALAEGKGMAQETVNLADLRKALDGYLSDFEKENGGFPNALPPIPLENLSVVAFVQDDGDKRILHAVQTPVAEVRKGAE